MHAMVMYNMVMLPYGDVQPAHMYHIVLYNQHNHCARLPLATHAAQSTLSFSFEKGTDVVSGAALRMCQA